MTDTETTITADQQLLFGAAQLRHRTVLGAWVCHTEILIYADNLATTNPDGFKLLHQYAATNQPRVHLRSLKPGEVTWRLLLMSRTEFARFWWRTCVPGEHNPDPAMSVFFNAPFDISRLATHAGLAETHLRGGFSFDVFSDPDQMENKYAPRIGIKSVGPKRAFIRYRGTRQGDSPGGKAKVAGFNGQFLDLATAVFALTGKSYTLDGACDLYNVPGKAKFDRYGEITEEAIDYCRQDVTATAGLLEKVVTEFEKHPIKLQLTKAYSSASISKAYLAAMGITPFLAPGGPAEHTPAWMLACAMEAFYGGRAETNIRLTPTWVTLLDFKSMYPLVNALMGSWWFIVAQRITTSTTAADITWATDLIRDLTPETMFNKLAWRDLMTLVEITPEDDMLPVRAHYNLTPTDPDTKRGETSIGLSHLTDGRGHWYTLADVIGAVLRSGRIPTIHRVIRFKAHGKQRGLKPVRLAGKILVDPRLVDFFVQVINLRNSVAEGDPAHSFLKILANAGSYGIFAEMNSKDDRGEVTLHPTDPLSEATRVFVDTPEEPGEYSYTPLAACITGAARLMLTLVELEVTRRGGTWVFCDTDSLAVHTLNPNDPDERPVDARPLTDAEVAEIQAQFNQLNPFDEAVVPQLLNREKGGTGYCVSISAKRYAVYTRTAEGEIVLSKWSKHGLGQYMCRLPGNDDRNAWIKEAWVWIIRRLDDPLAPGPAWPSLPAVTQLAISSPHLWRPFRTYNADRPWSEQIKPYGFMLVASVDPLSVDPGEHPRIIAPYTRDIEHAAWFDRSQPDEPLELFDNPAFGVRLRTLGNVIDDYLRHPEHKRDDLSGKPCRGSTRGMLQPAHVEPSRWEYIGKETNRLSEVDAGYVTTTEATTVYGSDWRDELDQLLEPYGYLSGRELSVLLGVDRRTIDRARVGSHKRRPDRLVERLQLLRKEAGATGFPSG